MIDIGKPAGNLSKYENHACPPSLPKERDRVTYPVGFGFIHWINWTLITPSSQDSRMMVTIILESFKDGGFIFIPKRSETWVLRSLQTSNRNDDQGPTFSHRRVAATQLLPLPTLRTPGETQCPFVALHSWSFGCFISWCPEIWWLMAKDFWGHSSFFVSQMCDVCDLFFLATSCQ